MTQSKPTLLIAGIALAALALSACATKKDVTAMLAPVSAQTQSNADQISKTQSDLASAQTSLGGQITTLNGQVSGLDGRVTQISATAQQALDRATAAGVLAQGKFLYSVVLSDDSVKFPANSSKLSPEATQRLDELVGQLKSDNKNVYLEVQGFTDATGSPATNDRLGSERAEAVRKYLSLQGVPLNRISTISYGEDNPVAANTTRDGRAQNRRVVIQVLS